MIRIEPADYEYGRMVYAKIKTLSVCECVNMMFSSVEAFIDGSLGSV